MDKRFTRRELYDLVWSKPIREIAATLGVSDVWVAKACRKADIVVPGRGHWAKRRAGKRTLQAPLAARFFGAPETVEFGGRSDPAFWARLIAAPAPPPPIFEEDMAGVEARARKVVGKVKCPQLAAEAHPLIQALLDEDNRRRPEFAKTGRSWDRPRYDSPLEMRQLRILNAVFLAAARIGCRPSISQPDRFDQTEADVGVAVGEHRVAIKFVQVDAGPISKAAAGKKGRLRLTIDGSPRPVDCWEDGESGTLESRIDMIVVGILVAAESSYRYGVLRRHQWILDEQRAREERAARQAVERARQERELRERQAQERIERLLHQAAALDRADTIRGYITRVPQRTGELGLSAKEVQVWASWARREADRIDPVRNGAIEGAVREIAEEQWAAE